MLYPEAVHKGSQNIKSRLSCWTENYNQIRGFQNVTEQKEHLKCLELQKLSTWVEVSQDNTYICV